MKKISLLLVIVFLVGFGANAQTKSNGIKINPLSAFLATGNVAYERAVSESSSVQLGVFYTGVSFGDTQFSGFGITPEYRFYVGNGEALDGFYIGPFLRYQNFTVSDDVTSTDGSLSTFGGGVLLGRQWLAGEAFIIDVFIGPSYNGGSVDGETEGADFENTGLFTGIGVRWGVMLGFGF